MPAVRMLAAAAVASVLAQSHAADSTAILYQRLAVRIADSDIGSNATAPLGLSEEECKSLCTADPACGCVARERSAGQCWKREACETPLQPKSVLRGGLDVFVKKEYQVYADADTYFMHGSLNIDTGLTAPTGLSPQECMERCTADPVCGCAVHIKSSGKCYKRSACNPCRFRTNVSGREVLAKKRGDDDTTCSPDDFDWIRDIAAGTGGKFFLEAKTYHIDRQYQLPPNTEIHGAGSGGSLTVVKAVGPAFWNSCGDRARNRKGFLLNDNTYVGKLHFVGMDDRRHCDNQLLCGGAPFETPGCKGTGKFEEAPEACGGDLGLGHGVQNASVEDVTIEAFTVQNAFYAAPTKQGARASKDITIRGVICNGTWADGMNVHGAHENVLVEDCEIRNTGDDTYAIWSVGVPGADNITFRRNVAENPWFRFGCSPLKSGMRNSNFCFAVYGGRSSRFVNNTCRGAHAAVGFGSVAHKTFGGTFTNESSTLVRGVRGMQGEPCFFGVDFKGTVEVCTAEGY